MILLTLNNILYSISKREVSDFNLIKRTSCKECMIFQFIVKTVV